mgnify:CR=1 FL=1
MNGCGSKRMRSVRYRRQKGAAERSACEFQLLPVAPRGEKPLPVAVLACE